MRWRAGTRSNVDDLRGQSMIGRAGIPLGGGAILALLLLSWLTGTDFLSLFSGSDLPDGTGTSGQVASTPEEERRVDFVDAVMGDLQMTWKELIPGRYEDTRVVLFRDAVPSACGFAESATGPFYCPSDQRVYLDLGFFDELDRRFGAPGDFAQAYVIGHEVGHHVQNLLGIERNMRSAQAQQPSRRNALSVSLELQADCFAGVWGHAAAQSGRFSQGRIELDPGDVDEGLNAAAAIGDDRLQRMSSGRVMPDAFTHGSSEQRVSWFRRGLSSGGPGACTTFDGRLSPGAAGS